MKKFEIRELYIETKDGKDPFGVFLSLTNQETELIASYDTLEEARKNFGEYGATVRKALFGATYYLHECYAIEESEYNEDGERESSNGWWDVVYEEWEDEEETPTKD